MIYHPPPKQKVYILMAHEDEDDWVEKVFADKSDAERVAETSNKQLGYFKYEVQEWEVEPGSPFVNA